jgi:hypothetical protein
MLVPAQNIIVGQRTEPFGDLTAMTFGNMSNDGGHLLLDAQEARDAVTTHGVAPEFLHPFMGSDEFINGVERRCIWVDDNDYVRAKANKWLSRRFDSVADKRRKSSREATAKLCSAPFRFGEVRQSGTETAILVPSVSSEGREYLSVGFAPSGALVPLHVIDEAVQRIRDGSITEFIYDPQTARLVGYARTHSKDEP